MNTGKRNRNFKIMVQVDRYHIGFRVFTSLDELIRYYQSHVIFTDDQQRFFLTQAFVYPGTPELELDRSEYVPTFRPYDSAQATKTSNAVTSIVHRPPVPPSHHSLTLGKGRPT